jgi:Fis family transcriptional regulator, factor for inversion stimulation protein
MMNRINSINHLNHLTQLNDSDMARTVRKAIDGYFNDLDGEKASGVYDMVINCVEKPLLESVLTRVRGNQTHAAQMLGLNRNTLRKKMKAHGIKF